MYECIHVCMYECVCMPVQEWNTIPAYSPRKKRRILHRRNTHELRRSLLFYSTVLENIPAPSPIVPCIPEDLS